MHLLNWATDGAGARRQIFDSLMSHPLSKDSAIFPYISTLKLLDMNVGEHQETVDFDSKHLAKRLQNALDLISIFSGNIGDNKERR